MKCKMYCYIVFGFVGFGIVLTCAVTLYAQASNRKISGSYCSPQTECQEGVLTVTDGDDDHFDGCKKSFRDNCTGTCYWCDGSSNVGRVCVLYENAECAVSLLNPTTIPCGPKTSHPCINGGGYGPIECCPPSTYMPTPAGTCEATVCLF